MTRVTAKPIKARLEHLNKTLNRPAVPWKTNGTGKIEAQTGNLHLYRCLGVWAIHEMTSKGGAVNVILSAPTARELLNLLVAYEDGIKEGKKS